MIYIPLASAVMCCNCDAVSDSRSDRCPACGADGSLLSLARVLNPSPEMGTITFLLALGRSGDARP